MSTAGGYGLFLGVLLIIGGVTALTMAVLFGPVARYLGERFDSLLAGVVATVVAFTIPWAALFALGSGVVFTVAAVGALAGVAVVTYALPFLVARRAVLAWYPQASPDRALAVASRCLPVGLTAAALFAAAGLYLIDTAGLSGSPFDLLWLASSVVATLLAPAGVGLALVQLRDDAGSGSGTRTAAD